MGVNKDLVEVSDMRVEELIKELQQYDGELEVFTKKEDESFGNIGGSNSTRLDKYASFGELYPCVIISDIYREEME